MFRTRVWFSGHIRRDFKIKSGGKKIYFKGAPHFIDVIKHFWMYKPFSGSAKYSRLGVSCCIHGAWYVAGTEPNFPLNAPQPNLPGHVVAILYQYLPLH